jgi:long-chain acyl-CoA synthetase
LALVTTRGAIDASRPKWNGWRAPSSAGAEGDRVAPANDQPAGAGDYWSGPGQIDAPSDGWFHTGDLMREREDDELWFVSCKKDLIIRGGSNISPIEVERVLIAHPAVRDAAVVGVPDKILGQRVVGLVRLEDNVAVPDDILADAQARLADYKVPEWLEVVDEIPRNALGKINRTSLLAIISDSRVRRDG